MRPLAVVLVLGLAVVGCLTPPVLEPRRDASAGDAPSDAPRPPFEVASFVVFDASGEPWPVTGVPRIPSIALGFTSPPSSLDDGCLLVRGGADADLLDDLDSPPLRDATRARLLPVRIEAAGNVVTLTPNEQLAPGTTWTVVAAAWVTRSDGSWLGRPFLREITVSEAAAAGARATDSWPPDGAFAVPTAPDLVALRFDGDVSRAATAIELTDGSGRAIGGSSAQFSCADLGWETGTCATFRPFAPLAPRTTHSVTVRAGTHDATGALVPEMTASFVTSDSAVGTPLRALALVCTIEESPLPGGCTRRDDESFFVRMALSDAARITWSAEGRTGSSIAPRGDVRILVSGLAPSRPMSIEVHATGYTGIDSAFYFLVTTANPLPTLSITEVRADPAGAEPRQEYVELLNYGTSPIDLDGLFLSDAEDAEGDPLPAIEIAPGARALLVTTDFDPDDLVSGDARVPPGALLVRLDRALGAGGLSNGGEPVFLHDAEHHRISSAPATPRPIEGTCIVRTASSMRSGEPGTFEYDSLGTCTPGR